MFHWKTNSEGEEETNVNNQAVIIENKYISKGTTWFYIGINVIALFERIHFCTLTFLMFN